MSTPSSPAASPAPIHKSKPDPRQAALLAAEARLKSLDPSPTTSTSTSTSTTTTSTAVLDGSTPPLFRPNGSGQRPGSGSGSGWTPTEKEERECRIRFARLLDRGLVRDNGYRQVAEGVETLILIAKNVMEHDDPKYRTLKATNSMLKNKVLSLKGGHEYLIALGFRTQTIDFNQHYVFHSSLKSSFELRTGTEVLTEHLSSLQSRASNAVLSATAHKEAEAARVAQALAQIEADREQVKVRRQRDGVMREREERLRREEREKREREEEEVQRRREEAERLGTGDGRGLGGMTVGGMAGGMSGTGEGDEDDVDEDEEEDEEEEEEEEEGRGHQWSQSGGRTLAD